MHSTKMSNSDDNELFQFLPNPNIPEIEILTLASNLPHLSLETNIKQQPNIDNRWGFDVKNN